MMKAAVYRSFNGPIQIENIPKPTIPPDDGVIIKVMATGVCRSDWHGWKGHDGDIINHGLPFVPGHEFSGIITAMGRHVAQNNNINSLFRIGDRVTVPFILSCGTCHSCCQSLPTVCSHQEQPGFTRLGSFAEYIAIPRALRHVTRLPDNVSFQAAAALGCRFTTAYRATIQQGQLRLGQSVGIFGCGGLGLSCIMLSKAAGASMIIACDVSQRALDKALQLGATHIIQVPKKKNNDEKNSNHMAMIESIREEILTIIRNSHSSSNNNSAKNNSNSNNSNFPDGTDLTIDAAGFTFTCECAIHCTGRGGTMVQVGLPTGPPPEVPMGLVVAREIHIAGSHGFPPVDLPNLLQMISSHQIDPTQLIEKQVNLRQGAQAIQNMDHGSPLGITMITSFNDNDDDNTAPSESSSPSSTFKSPSSRL